VRTGLARRNDETGADTRHTEAGKEAFVAHLSELVTPNHFTVWNPFCPGVGVPAPAGYTDPGDNSDNTSNLQVSSLNVYPGISRMTLIVLAVALHPRPFRGHEGASVQVRCRLRFVLLGTECRKSVYHGLLHVHGFLQVVDDERTDVPH
jgi:hypothetical protein